MALDGSYLHDHASQLYATDASVDEVATVSNGLDRGRVYVEAQATLLRHDNNGVNVEIPSSPSLSMNRVSRPGSQVPSASNYAATQNNVVLLLDANGRVGQDYRCTESHETTNEWVSVGPGGSEVTSPNGKRLVLICEQGGLFLRTRGRELPLAIHHAGQMTIVLTL